MIRLKPWSTAQSRPNGAQRICGFSNLPCPCTEQQVNCPGILKWSNNSIGASRHDNCIEKRHSGFNSGDQSNNRSTSTSVRADSGGFSAARVSGMSLCANSLEKRIRLHRRFKSSISGVRGVFVAGSLCDSNIDDELIVKMHVRANICAHCTACVRRAGARNGINCRCVWLANCRRARRFALSTYA